MYAVVGMDCVLPGARGADAWIRLSTPQIREVPDLRWPMPRGGAPGEPTTTSRGGFVAPSGVDRVDSAITGLEADIDALDPLFAWVVAVVRGALPAGASRRRTTLALAALGLPSTGMVRAVSAPIVRRLGVTVPWLAAPWHRLDRHPAGAPAAFAAAALGLGGEVDALDAACASGLYAVRAACDRLDAGEAEIAVAAAVCRADAAYLFEGFSRLQALSPSGTPRPLDRRADGLVVGEGAVAVALRHLADAVRDGDPIHAVIRGVGLGSDGRKGNMLAPAEAGQLRAMSAAWSRAGLDPSTVGAVECHATGTALGDGVELRALRALLADRAGDPVAVSSAKALIGHTVTAAGLAGLVRAVGYVRDGFLPAAHGVDAPRDELAPGGPLVALQEAQPWDDGARRAAVSAFGFGGTNAHAIVDRWDPASPPGPVPRALGVPELAVVAIAVQVGGRRDGAWLAAVDAGQAAGSAGFVDGLALDPLRFKIPPVELADALPQQVLALELAADAVERAPRLDPRRTASVVGYEVDPQVAHPVARWALAAAGRTDEADAVHPPLSASRVQGSLPNFVANRIAAQLGLEGPSYVVAAGARSGLQAVRHAARLLVDPELDAAVVGAVDLSGPPLDGDAGVVFVVRRLADAESARDTVFAVLRCSEPEPTGLDAQPPGYGAADGVVAAATAIAGDRPVHLSGLTVIPRARPTFPADGRARTLVVPRAPVTPEPPAFSAPFGGATVPVPRPRPWGEAERAPSPRPPFVRTTAVGPPLGWTFAAGPTSTASTPSPGAPVPTLTAVAPAPVVSVPYPTGPAGPAGVPDAAGIAALAASLARATGAAADAHARFLAVQDRATAPLAALAEALAAAAVPAVVSAADRPASPVAGPVPAGPRQPEPRQVAFDRAALLRHAGGPLSSVFGPGYADLDAFEPRVRMPLPPLLLCDRVVAIEGARGAFGPARIVTEYDVPTGSPWTADGRPPAFVVVESGQADLFLVSYLGIDAENRGERVYRLLDCDLRFVGARPEPGTTLRHDIRVDRFARLGATTLFYFHYDCVDAATGRPVLEMRNGCAGFFTPRELASPRGLNPEPRRDVASAVVSPLLGPPPGVLDTSAVVALAEGRFSEAFGPSFAPADGSALRLPPDPRWRLVHRVSALTLAGGAHGRGMVVIEQDLRDDDWFNPVHFHGDPCMPGTLMLEGCLQAVQTWLLALGVAAAYPNGRFEVRPTAPIRLRCRGQVVPGHKRLTYTATIVDAGLEPRPYAVADVVLAVDGVQVVIAHDVGVEVTGERIGVAVAPRMPALPRRDQVLAFSIGSAVQAFGPAYAPFDAPYAGGRCARMPGPPLLQMTEVLAVDGAPGEIQADRGATIAWDVPTDAWFWRADPSGALPFVILLETALQPCGWVTAWQQAGILDGQDLYFRNLGGEAIVHRDLRRDDAAAGRPARLLTTVRQLSVSASAGMQIQRFSLDVRDERGEPVLTGETQFGYFTKAALAAQRGLGAGDRPPPAELTPLDVRLDGPDGHPALPRGDLRAISRVVAGDPTGGAAGLGRYRAEQRVDPGAWFFTAHFWLDPVMPGSLGLEALLQLARWVWYERTGVSGAVTAVPPMEPLRWTYRGQVLQTTSLVTVDLEVTRLDRAGIRCRGWLLADGVPIYVFDGFGVDAVVSARTDPPAVIAPADGRVAALLDGFDRVPGADAGVGRLRLDPKAQPWLDDHRPTLTVAAVPLAFVAEVAAEAALALAPDSALRVVGLPEVRVDGWIHAGFADEPVDVTVAAVRDGDTVAVTLAVDGDPPGHARARAVVALGAAYPSPPAPPRLDAPAVDLDADAFFAAGHTFHGPSLQALRAIDRLGPAGAAATLVPGDDPRALGPTAGPHRFALDPVLLDAATHPMFSGSPDRWAAEIGPGRLAYPVRVEDLRLFGPRPIEGPVQCVVTLVAADRRSLVFDVHLAGWCQYRWREVVVPGGPLLGQAPPVRRAFLWDGAAVPAVRIGEPSPNGGWLVAPRHVIEPIPGTLAALYGAPGAEQPLAVIAVKELLRDRLRAGLGDDIHPRDLGVTELSPGLWVATDAPTLTAAAFVAWLHPTRVAITVRTTSAGAEATTTRAAPAERVL